MKNVSIRGRAAYALIGLENTLKAFNEDLMLWEYILNKLWEITNLEFVDDWLYTTSEILPDNILEDPYSPENFESLQLHEYNQLKQCYSNANPFTMEIIGKIFKIGTIDLYGKIVDNSPETLKTVLEIKEMLIRKNVQLPDETLFQKYDIRKKNGWGIRFERTDFLKLNRKFTEESMEKLDLISRFYESLDFRDDNLVAEYDLVQKIKGEVHDHEKDLDWEMLSDDEKQIKRILILKGVKKVLNQHNKDLFRFEESIIDLYESIVSCLNKLEDYSSMKPENIFVRRLQAMLQIEQMIINQNKDPRKIADLHFDLIKHLIYNCLNIDIQEFFIKKSGILFFESKLQIVQRLKKEL